MLKNNALRLACFLSLPFYSPLGLANEVLDTISLSAEALGIQTATDMNKRFVDTRDTCDSNPAWFCNGIMIRAANATTAYHAWDPSPSAKNLGGVSFSYFRADISTTRLQGARTQGFTIKAGQEGEKSVNPLTVLCSFPYDAGTLNRGNKGCGVNKNYSSVSRECGSQGITTARQWLAHFTSVPANGASRYEHQCGFAADSAGFAASLEARRISKPQDQNVDWSQNELAVKTWDSGIAEQLPLESFFYIPAQQNTSSATSVSADLSSLAGAQYMQRDYYQQTGIIVPVIRMTPGSADRQIFSWRAEDQAISTGKIAPLFPDIPDVAGEKSKQLTKAYYYRLPYLAVSIPHYDGMAAGDSVSVRWTSPNHTYNSEEKTIGVPGPITFQVPRVEVIDSIGHTAQISFAVRRANKTEERSSALPVQVEGQGLDLPAPTISSDLHTVVVSFNGMMSSHRVSVRLEGVQVHDTALQYGAGTLSFSIPESWLQENRGKTVIINYAVGDDKGSQYQFSRILRIAIP